MLVSLRHARLMAAFLLCGLFLLSTPGHAASWTVDTVPNVRLQNAANHVSNPDGIINQEDAALINQLASSLEQEYGVQTAIVALTDIGMQEPRQFANELFRHWGIGSNSTDNGLLILLVTGEGNRSIVFETGYGLEGTLTDANSYRLQQQYMVPDLREGRFSEGMLKGMQAVAGYIRASDLERQAMLEPVDVEPEMLYPSLSFLFLVFIVFMMFARSRRRPKKCPRCGKKTYAYAGTEVLEQPTATMNGMVSDVWRCSNCGYTDKTSRGMYSGGRDAAWAALLGAVLGSLGGRGGFGGGGFGGGPRGGSWGGGRSGGGGSISRF